MEEKDILGYICKDFNKIEDCKIKDDKINIFLESGENFVVNFTKENLDVVLGKLDKDNIEVFEDITKVKKESTKLERGNHMSLVKMIIIFGIAIVLCILIGNGSLSMIILGIAFIICAFNYDKYIEYRNMDMDDEDKVDLIDDEFEDAPPVTFTRTMKFWVNEMLNNDINFKKRKK